jgi:poly(3-hydroxybutyrate) depolymerase
MRTFFGSFVIGSALLASAGCSSSTTPDSPPASGGTPGASGSSATVGGGGTNANAGTSAGGSGGSASGGVTSGGMGSGGSSGTAGSGGAGGTTSGGESGSGGAGGMSGAGGGEGGAHTPVPSAGCGKANPAQGALTIMTGGQTANFNLKLPDGYDPSKPVPLGFGFHGFGNDECGPTQGECRGFAMLPAVTVYMKSISDGWEQSQVLEQNVTFWRDVLARVKGEYCIDESRIFIAGVSSGGQFIEHLTCRYGDELWQVTPVSASVVNSANQNCKGTPPILVIHGVTDQAGNYGEGVAAMFAKRNGCSETPPAELAQNKTDLMTAFNAKQAEHRCMDWQGCTKNPVRFCLSSQITYSGLTHGWPQIGGMLIGEFQNTLPK